MDGKPQRCPVHRNTPVDIDRSASFWLRLTLDRRCRPILQSLATLSCQPQSLPEQLQTMWPAVLGLPPDQATNARINAALDWQVSADNRHLIGWDHPDFPPLLRAIPAAPALLYVQGQLAALRRPTIAVVGARKASHAALGQAEDWAAALAQLKISVVSGLAVGVDAAAHCGSLREDDCSIAVSATSADRVYPRQHRQLAERIMDRGALLTEFHLDTPLRRWHFPKRNRLISGLSHAVLVLEAGLPSGTLTTARHALEQGRDVLAVPGSILDPLKRGCHSLLRDGATLIDSRESLVDAIAPTLKRHWVDESVSGEVTSPTSQGHIGSHAVEINARTTHADGATLLDCLGFDANTIDTLVDRLGWSVSRIAAALTELELSGLITREAGGRYVRCKQ